MHPQAVFLHPQANLKMSGQQYIGTHPPTNSFPPRSSISHPLSQATLISQASNP